MKVFYNGFNLHRQFPSTQNIVGEFIDHHYQDLETIEVSYQYVVLLVAGVIQIKGAKNESFKLEDGILQISCNEDKILVVLKNGDLVRITETVNKVPKILEMEDDDSIIKVSLGSKIIVALTKNGFLYNMPNKLEFCGNEITQIETGREHCLLLDKKGNVYSFGRGSRGQLGHGILDDEVEPELIEALAGVEIQCISAGGWHSCALSRHGDVYVWGWNSDGQLGLETNSAADKTVCVITTPQVLDLDFNILKICCGNKHTVALAENGKLYGCGSNKYKQLKNDPEVSICKMTYLWDFRGQKVKDIKAGPWNTIVICEEK